jgi:hypothetical protein
MRTKTLSRPTFEQRLSQRAKDAEEQAWKLEPGPERDALLRKARQLDMASHLNEWLASPSLPPK